MRLNENIKFSIFTISPSFFTAVSHSRLSSLSEHAWLMAKWNVYFRKLDRKAKRELRLISFVNFECSVIAMSLTRRRRESSSWNWMKLFHHCYQSESQRAHHDDIVGGEIFLLMEFSICHLAFRELSCAHSRRWVCHKHSDNVAM